jgi:hypothetical protein
VRGGPGVGEAAALLDRHVHQHRAGTHAADEVGADQLGRRGTGHQHGADDKVGREALLLDRLGGRGDRADARPEPFPRRAQSVGVAVEDRDLSLHADRHRGRVDARDTGADDDDRADGAPGTLGHPGP